MRIYLVSFLCFVFLATGSSQTYQYLRFVVDSSENCQLRELDWFDDDVAYPTQTMTAWNTPSPLVVTGSNANWERHRMYDGSTGTHTQVGQITSVPSITRDYVLDLGSGNAISPDSLGLSKGWGGITTFRVLLSNDNENWELYLDTTLAIPNFLTATYPLSLVVDETPPTQPQNLTSPNQTPSIIHLSWEASTDDNLVDQYHIYQDGTLIDSTANTIYAVENLAAETNYSFYVIALDKARNNSVASNSIMISTLEIDNTAPNLNGSLNVLYTDYNQAALSWSAATDNQIVNGYIIQLDGIATGTTDETSYTLAGLRPSTTYAAQIYAKDDAGNVSSTLSTSFTTPAYEGEMILSTNFWNQNWSSPNTQLFVNGHENVTGTNPWKPALLNEIDYAQTLRFMEMQLINGTPTDIWADRKPKTDPNQNELAYEWMIDLCTRADANLWVCVPNRIIDRNGFVGGTEHYIRKLAILLKTGVDMLDINLDDPGFENLSTFTRRDFILKGGQVVCEPLPSHLKIYIEYGNENWNGIFPQTNYGSVEGAAMGFGGPVAAAKYFSAYASVLVFQEFENVFGTDPARIEKVLPIQVSEAWYTNQFFVQIFDNVTLNPQGIMPNIVSGASYFGNGLDGSAADIEAQLMSALNSRQVGFNDFRTLLDDLGDARGREFRMVAYEGGHHVVTNFAELNNNPIIYDLYVRYLDSMNVNFEETVLYSHVATNAFGLKQSVGQTEESAHKYRAVVNWPFATVLPVELVYFKGEKIEETKGLLQWATSLEQNNKGFELEKSTDGTHFATIAFIDNGTRDDNLTSYNYVDEDLKAGHNIYRLTQHDLDGTTTSLGLVSIFHQAENQIIIYPNPVKDIMRLTCVKTSICPEFKILNQHGVVVYERKQNDGQDLDLRFLPAGLYLLQTPNGITEIIKQ